MNRVIFFVGAVAMAALTWKTQTWLEKKEDKTAYLYQDNFGEQQTKIDIVGKILASVIIGLLWIPGLVTLLTIPICLFVAWLWDRREKKK